MSRDEIEKFLTDEGRAKVEQFMADSSYEDDDVDMDEVVRQNLADHAEAMGNAGAFQRDLDRRMQSPGFRRSYEEQARRLEASADEAADLDGAELLAVARAHHDTYAQSHSHQGAFACCSAHTSADDVPELLAEIERLKAERTRLRRELDRCAGLNCDLANEAADATARAETAERELAKMRAEEADPYNPQHIAQAVKRARRQRDEAVEAIAAERDEYVAELAKMRERIGKEGEEWSVVHVSGRDVHNSEANARHFAERASWAGARLEHRVVGEWKAAPEAGCRSCGTTERVLGDPPLCTNCANYGGLPRVVGEWKAADGG